MWRRLLIELSDEHRESILLNWCIRELSQLGYHREIAQVIREADYFSVCNALLIDTLLRLGSAIAEGGATDSDTDATTTTHSSGSTAHATGTITGTGTVDTEGGSSHDDIASLMTDLKRMCGSTEYMFIYTHFLLSEILNKLSPRTSSHSNKKRSLDQTEQKEEESSSKRHSFDPMKHMWRQKVRRIQEELEDDLVWRRDARGFSSRGWRVEALSGEAKFALQLTTENESIGICSNASVPAHAEREEKVKNLVRVMLESGSMTDEVVEQLCGHFFQRCEDMSVTSSDSVHEMSKEVVTLLPGTQAALTSLFAACASDSDSATADAVAIASATASHVRVLMHPQVLHMLIMNLVGGVSSAVNCRYSVACILALVSCSNALTCKEDCKSISVATQGGASPDVVVTALAEKIANASEICLNLGSLVS
mgnify:FL=1